MVIHPYRDSRFRKGYGMYGVGLSGLNGPAGASSCADYIANAFASMPPAATAAMLLNTPTPSGDVLAALYINSLPSTPAATAQAAVTQLAQEYCGAVQAEISSGDPNAAAPPDCGDGGTAAANAAYPIWLAYYSSLPATVWTQGTVTPQAANPNVFPQVTPATAATPTQVIRVSSPTEGPMPQTAPSVNTQGNVITPPAPTPTIQPGALVQNQTGSGTQTGPTAPPTGTTNPPVQPTGFNFSSIPTWAYLAGAGVLALLLLGRD